MSEENKKNLKSALGEWSKKHNIRPVDFARALGYTPSYGWNLLRGSAVATPEILGRFVLAYGIEATTELLELAGLPKMTAKASTLSPLKGVQVIPVISFDSKPETGEPVSA